MGLRLPSVSTTNSLADRGELDAAEREFTRAIELGRSNAQTHYWYSMLLVALGRGEYALRLAERGLELDPFSPCAAYGMKNSALFLISGERSYKKLPVSERRPILKLEAGSRGHARVTPSSLPRRDAAMRRAPISCARGGSSPPTTCACSPWLAQCTGGAARALSRALLAELKRRPDARDHAVKVARLHARFGEKDSAFVWLGRQQRWMLANRAFVSADPLMDSLRSDPRFPELLERLGIRRRRATQN